MKKFYLIILLFMYCHNTYSQFTINGIVKDGSTGSVLSLASVILKNTNSKYLTDNDGKFVFSNVTAGKNTISISYVGYKTQERELDVQENIFVDVQLSKSQIISDEVIIISTRASEKTAMAYLNIQKAEIEKRNFGQDVPFILSLTPSVVVTSDAGNGIGYTGLRIRGSDATRINVTINNVPVNDAESQQLYWVDLPDIATSIDNIQIQRGIGTSTNGAGAFGGSINIQTNNLNKDPYFETHHTTGSFGMVKNTMNFGTGLLGNHWVFDGRLSKINSDGYIDRGSANLKSIFISQGYYGKKSIVKLNIFSGKEISYQSWNGVPESRIKNDTNGMNEFVARNYLDSEDSLNLLSSGRTYNYYMYKNQVDDYQQDNYQLHYSLELSDKLILNTTLHYTKGKGFYEEYKKHQDLADYGILDFIPTTKDVSLVRRKWLQNDFYGTVYSLQYDSRNKISVTLGGGLNQYAGKHFNEIIFAQYFPLTAFPYQYENNSSLKTDFNIFGKIIVDFDSKTNLFADMQFRRLDYTFLGFTNNLIQIPQSVELSFFNPKLGFNRKLTDDQSVYASLSISNKEPSRDDYVDSSPLSRPKSENMQDVEVGYRLQKSNVALAFNYYFMNYKNQLVLTGQLNDVGNYTRTNIDKSYRTGIEMELGLKLMKSLKFSANLTLSKNKIKNFYQFVDDYDVGSQVLKFYTNTDIAFSPNIIASAILSYEPLQNINLDLTAKYVSKQYLNNTSDDSKKLKAYLLSDMHIKYNLKLKWMKEMSFGILVNNIFNHMYESNGYTYSYYYGGKEIVENFYYPQAGINVLGQISLKF